MSVIFNISLCQKYFRIKCGFKNEASCFVLKHQAYKKKNTRDLNWGQWNCSYNLDCNNKLCYFTFSHTAIETIIGLRVLHHSGPHFLWNKYGIFYYRKGQLVLVIFFDCEIGKLILKDKFIIRYWTKLDLTLRTQSHHSLEISKKLGHLGASVS